MISVDEAKESVLIHQKGNSEILRLRDQVREQKQLLQKQQRTIQTLEKELQSVLDSKVWRAADVFRNLIRVHLFNWFPSLQISVLPRCKRWYRNMLFLPLIRLGICKGEYEKWIALEQQALAATAEHVTEDIQSFHYSPQISLVMPVYNVKPNWLSSAVQSVQKQSYANWQLCIADDCSTSPQLKIVLKDLAAADQRISLVFLAENQGIAGASNAAFKMATGDYVGLLDNDDELAPNALYEVVKAVNREPDVD